MQSGSLHIEGDIISIEGATSDPGALESLLRRMEAVAGPDVRLSRRLVTISAESLSLETSCRRQLAALVSRERIEFAGDATQLGDAAIPILDRIAELLVDCPSLNLTVTGHSDSGGEPEANRDLSEARARAVLDQLVLRGVAQSRLAAVGAGAREPRYAGNDRFSRQANRRVEFSFAL